MKKVFILVLIVLSLNACMGNGVTICAIPEIIAIDTTHITLDEIQIEHHVDGGSSEAVLRKIIDYIENIK